MAYIISPVCLFLCFSFTLIECFNHCRLLANALVVGLDSDVAQADLNQPHSVSSNQIRKSMWKNNKNVRFGFIVLYYTVLNYNHTVWNSPILKGCVVVLKNFKRWIVKFMIIFICLKIWNCVTPTYWAKPFQNSTRHNTTISLQLLIKYSDSDLVVSVVFLFFFLLVNWWSLEWQEFVLAKQS